MNNITAVPQEAQARLRGAVASFSPNGYALLDGGHFDDLPAQLKQGKLFARSLFLDQVDIEVQKAGPRLVSVSQSPDAADRVFELVDMKPAAIFWHCEAGEGVLYKHLRTLNMASIPAWAAAGKQERDDQPEAYSLVFFRHFDPRVLGAVLPTFNARQLGRFIGPAEEVGFVSEEYGFKRVLSDYVSKNFSASPLVISADQIDAISERRTEVSFRRIGLYLRRYASSKTDTLNDNKLGAAISSYALEAKSLGINKESSLGIWAYMRMTSKNNLFVDRATRLFLADRANGPDADARVRACLLMRSESVG